MISIMEIESIAKKSYDNSIFINDFKYYLINKIFIQIL
jgi:hypothetical protein